MLDDNEFSSELKNEPHNLDNEKFDEYTCRETAEFVDMLMSHGKSFDEAIAFTAKSAKTFGKPEYTEEIIRQIYQKFGN